MFGLAIQWLKKKNQDALFEALQKLKEGLILLSQSFPPCLFVKRKFVDLFVMANETSNSDDVFFFFPTELMLLGFISLLLTVTQGAISRFCIPPHLAIIMLPCKRKTKGSSEEIHHVINNRRRLLSASNSAAHCVQKVWPNSYK